MEQDLSMQQITQAAAVIAPYVKTTPLIRAEKLEALFDGAEVWLKLENLQHTGSFKLRGVANKMLSLTTEELARGVTAASSGNHAQAVSYMAAKLGTHAAIVMPENAPQAKVDGARGYGAEVIQYGFTGEDRDFKCNELIAQHGYSLVHSHVDPYVIAGHATAATEALGQMEGKVDAVVMPCGAGSLTSGAARAVKGTDCQDSDHCRRARSRPPLHRKPKGWPPCHRRVGADHCRRSAGQQGRTHQLPAHPRLCGHPAHH